MAAYDLITYDFQAIKDALYTDVRSYPEWSGLPADQDSADTITKLFIYMLSYNTSLLAGMMNSDFVDSIPSLSTSFNVLYSFANFVGMAVRNRTSAEGYANFSIPSTLANQVIIPAETQISDSTGKLLFSTLQTAYINVGDTTTILATTGEILSGKGGGPYTLITQKSPIVAETVVIDYNNSGTSYQAVDALETGVLNFTETGTSSAASLAADANHSDGYYVGMTITITSGAGSGQTRTIAAYSAAANHRITVNTAWVTNPGTTSHYKITPVGFPTSGVLRGADIIENQTIATVNGSGYSITLSAGASAIDSYYNGWKVVAGGQTRIVSGYTAATRTLSVHNVAPNSPWSPLLTVGIPVVLSRNSAVGSVVYASGSISLTPAVTPYTPPVAEFSFRDSIPVVQGAFKTQNFVGTGGAYQKFYIFDTIEEYHSSVEVTTAGVTQTYTRVENFLFSTNLDYHYVIAKVNGGVYFLFGNGINGVAPALLANIAIHYLISLGISGNVYTSGVLKTVVSKILDSTGATVSAVKVDNALPAVGGYDGDDLQRVQQNISRFFSSQNLSTRDSYRDYLNSHQLVLDCRVLAGFEVYPLDTTKWMTIYFYVLPSQYPQVKTLSFVDKQTLFNYIKLRDTFFTFVDFLDLSYIGISVRVNLKLKSTLLNQSSINAIRNSVYNGSTGIVDIYFDFTALVASNGSAFRQIYDSELVDPIKNSSAVRAADVYLQTVERTSYVFANSAFDFTGASLQFEGLKPNETFLYLGNTEIGYYSQNGGTWTLVVTHADFLTKVVSVINVAANIVIEVNVTSATGLSAYNNQTFMVRCNPINDHDIVTANPNILFELYDCQTAVI